MPMSNSSNRSRAVHAMTRLRRDERGTSVIEFALALPVMLLMASGFIEIGRAFAQADAVEKSVRGAAEFAARNEFPLTAAAHVQIENLVRTGTLDGTGAVLVDGFSGSNATITVTTTTFDPGSGPVPVVHLSARVPYTPILSGLMSMVGIDTFSIEASHEQPYLGS